MATRLGKRPHPKNYATYNPKGKAQYRKDLAEYLKKKAAMEKEKTKLSTKKNLEKQKTANKKASTTTKAKAKGTTTVKPKATATKAKPLATKKTTTKTKAVETPKVTTTKRRAATSTTKKTVTKKPATTTKKPAAKKPPARKVTAKKPPARKVTTKKPAGKVPAKKPLLNAKQKLRIKKGATATKNLVKKGITKGSNFLKTQKTKLSAKDQTPQQANPEPKTRGQKLMSRLNKSYQAYKGQVLDKAGKDLSKKGKLRSGLGDKSLKAQSRGGTRASLAAGALTAGTNALVNRAFKPKNMTMAEFKAAKEKSNQEGVRKAGLRIKKLAGNVVNKVRGKGNNTSTQSSTTKNINKQKKTNNNLSAKNISKNKNKKNFYNTPDGKSPKAKEIATLQKNIKKAKGANKELLQKRVDYLQKFGKMSSFTVDRNSKAERQARNTNKSVSAPIKSAKPGSARAKMRAKNEARFGKAHVDKLRSKNRDFQALKKKKMTKAEFIRRYPKSITAQRAKGLR